MRGQKWLIMSELRTAVYLPTPRPRIAVYDARGQEEASTLLPEPAAPEATARRELTAWSHTGPATASSCSDGTTLTYRSTVGPDPAAPLGPGTMMVDRLLLSVPDGIAVYKPDDRQN